MAIYDLGELGYEERLVLMKRYIRRRRKECYFSWDASSYISIKQLMSKFKVGGLSRERKEKLLIKLFDDAMSEILKGKK